MSSANRSAHLELLDAFARVAVLKDEVAASFKRWSATKRDLEAHSKQEAEKFQLLDILRFQIDELERSQLVLGEDDQLDEERRRLNNVEKLTTLCAEGFALTYDDSDSAITRIRHTARRVEELAGYESHLTAGAPS